MHKNISILVFFILLMSNGIQAQGDTINNQIAKDTVGRMVEQKVVSVLVKQATQKDTVDLKTFKPDPLKVVWMGAIIPGYGQILNRKYWKLPIVYGGFLGFAYMISWNSGLYNTYKNAYLDLYKYNREDAAYKSNIDKNPSIVSFYQVLQKGYTVQDYGGPTELEASLKNAQDNYHRNRDLSIILSVAFYALTIVDAYVDAQLYDFDISPDLSVRFQPALIQQDYSATKTLAMQLHFSLK